MKFTLTLSDGTTKDYSRKIDATRAGEKDPNGYLLKNPAGDVLHNSLIDTVAAPDPEPAAAPETPQDRPTRAKVGTFDVTGKDGQTHTCTGACGETLPVKKFPTTGDARRRSAECRTCRDARTKAEKAARAAAKASA